MRKLRSHFFFCIYQQDNSQKLRLIQKKAVFLHKSFSDMSIIAFIREHGGYIRSKDIDNRAMYDQLLAEVADGNVVRIRNGIYALPNEMAKTMVDVEKIVPGGVVCMYSAWAYYELTTKLPPDICIAIEKKRKVILPDYPPVALYYWSQTSFELGIVEREIEGYRIRIYDLEKSVCDAVKFRNKIGIDVSSEILRNYLSRTDRNLTRLNGYARKMRVANVMNGLIDYMV